MASVDPERLNFHPENREITTVERREFITSAVLAGVASSAADSAVTRRKSERATDDRQYMLDLLVRMARPVLASMSEGKLQAVFKPELSPTWDGRNVKVAYLEGFGRLISGIAPWLAL